MKNLIITHGNYSAASISMYPVSRRFQIDFGEHAAFLVDGTRVIHASAKTVGELNRQRLHEMLDEYINDYIQRAERKGAM